MPSMTMACTIRVQYCPGDKGQEKGSRHWGNLGVVYVMLASDMPTAPTVPPATPQPPHDREIEGC